MALEEQISELTAAVKENTEVLRAVLAQAGATDGGNNAPEKPKATRTRKTAEPKDEGAAEEAKTEAKTETKSAPPADVGDEDGDVVTFDSVKDELAKWLGAFAKPEDKDNPDGMHPEAAARKAAVKAALEKLGAAKLVDLKDDQEKVNRLKTWLDKKKAADTGFGEGRLAADPAPAKAAADEDDDI